MVLVTASCTMLQTSVHSSSGTLSTRSNPLNLFTGIVFWVQYVADARASSQWALKDLLLKARPLYTGDSQILETGVLSEEEKDSFIGLELKGDTSGFFCLEGLCV